MKHIVSWLFIIGVTQCALADINVVPLPNGLSGSGTTTRYWDCCKPSCSWADLLNQTYATEPVRSCSADGESTIYAGATSGCLENGTSFMCTDQQSVIVNETVSLGFVAASFTAGADFSKCCTCLVLSFKDQIANKQMIVQVTNTGTDLNKNHFDIAMPGGGVGIFNGCSSEWNSPVDGWGDRYGGVHSIEECNNLPSQLQSGCQWRFQWFEGADNPEVDFYEIECPKEITDISNCK